MENKSVFTNDFYIISKDFRLLSFNESVEKKYTGIKKGDFCYKATMNRDSPCLHCPIAGYSDCDNPVYYDPFYENWIESIFSDSGDGTYAVMCRPAKDRGFRVFDSLGKEDNQNLIKLVSGGAANKTLLEMEKLLAETTEIMANAGYGIWSIVINENGKNKLSVNNALAKILGVDTQNYTAEEMYDYFHERLICDKEDIEKNDYRQMLSGRIMSRLFPWDHPQKGKIYLRAGGTVYTGSDNQKLISGYCGDVSEEKNKNDIMTAKLKQALENAEAANVAKTTFLNNMSHDIRTPMNAILGFARLIKKDLTDVITVESYVGKIQQAGEYLLTIINNVLDMARIDSGKVEIAEDIMDVNCEGAVFSSLFENEIKRRRIQFHPDTDIIHPCIIADVTKIRQIMVNLMSNALKYTPEGGTIDFGMYERPSDKEGYATYITTIADNGIGMSRDFVSHVFESFTRERNTTDSRIVGTGLGMSIVKKLVECMNGKIEVESELGKGTRFTITMVHKIVDNPQSYIEQNKSPEDAAKKVKGKRVLLAEDNDLNSEIAIAILDEYNISVELAENGAICVEMMETADSDYYDAILMDLQMPVMDGFEAAKKIRSMEDKRKACIPILAMTANAFSEDREKVLRAGMNGHIAKPIDVDAMIMSIAAVV